MQKIICSLVAVFLITTENYAQKTLVVTDYATQFKDGLLAIKKKDYWGYADTSGNIVMDFIIPDFRSFENEIPSHTNKVFVSSTYPKVGFKLVDTNAKLLSDTKFSVIGNFNEGLAMAAIQNKEPNKNSSIAYTNEKGQRAFNLPVDVALNTFNIYLNLSDYLGDFHDGLAYVARKDKQMINPLNKYGFINNKGILTIPYQYEKTHSFYNNRCAVAKRNKYNELLWGYIDKQGNTKIDFIFSNEPGNFSNGFTWVSNSDNLFGLIDSNGKRITEFIYNYVSPFKEEVSVCQRLENNSKENYYSLIDIKGKVIKKLYGFTINSTEINNVSFLNPMQEGKLVVYDVNLFLYGAVNKQGKTVIPFKFTKLEPFVNGRAYAEINYGEQKGFINANAEWVILIEKK